MTTRLIRTCVLLLGSSLLRAQSSGQATTADPATGWQTIKVLGQHPKPIVDLLFYPDGRALASVDVGNSAPLWGGTPAQVWDMYDGQLMHPSSPIFNYHAGGSKARAILPDGRAAQIDGGGRVKVWDLERGGSQEFYRPEDTAPLSEEIRRHLDAPRPEPSLLARASADMPSHTATASTLSPDQRTLAIAGKKGAIHIWDARAARRIATLTGHTDEVLALAFSPDGRTLASGGYDRSVRVHRLNPAAMDIHAFPSVRESSAAARPVQLPTYGLDWFQLREDVYQRPIPISSSTTWLMAWAAGDKLMLGTWQEARLHTKEFTGHHGGLQTTAISQDGLTLASSGHDGFLRTWDATTGAIRAELPLDHAHVKVVALSPDGRDVAFAVAHEVQLSADGRPAAPLPDAHAHDVTALGFSPAKRILASGDAAGRVVLWNLQEKSHRPILNEKGHAISRVAFSLDGGTLAAAREDGTILIWDVARGRAKAMIRQPPSRDIEVALSPKGDVLASASISTKMFNPPWKNKFGSLWAVDSGRQLAFWQATIKDRTPVDRPLPPAAPFFGMAFSQDGKLVAHARNAHSLETVDWPEIGSRYQDSAGRFSDDGVGNRSLTGFPAPIGRVAFSPDGRTLAVSTTEGTVLLWDIEYRGLTDTLHGPPIGFSSLAIGGPNSIDGSAADGTVWQWRRNSPRESWTRSYRQGDGLRQSVGALAAYAGSDKALASSSDGRLLLTAGPSPEARLWDSEARRLKALVRGHSGALLAAAFSPDGRFLALGGEDRTVRIVRLSAPLLGTPKNPNLVDVEPATPALADDVDTPPRVGTPHDPEAYAVVIGVEKHRQAAIPPVEFAARDAQTVFAYLTEAMGFDPRNVLLLDNEHASKAELEKSLGVWLRNRATPRSRVLVYYSGRGAPNPETGEPFLVPYDADPAYIDDTGYPLSRLFATLARLPALDVRVVLDACFTGRGGRSLIAQGLRPLVTVKNDSANVGANTVWITASGENGSCSSYPDGRHGLLTHFLLKGLRGGADTDGDRRVGTAELFRYLKPLVEEAARKDDARQSPSITPALGKLGEKGGWTWLDLPTRR